MDASNIENAYMSDPDTIFLVAEIYDYVLDIVRIVSLIV